MRNKVCYLIMLLCCIGLCISVTGCKSSKETGTVGKYDGEVLYNGFDSTKDMYRVAQLFEWNYSPMAKLEVVGKDDFLPVVVEDEATIAKQAAAVEKMIEKLPALKNLKLSDKAAVSEARSAYGDLAKSGKMAVTNLNKLKELEASPVLKGLHTIGDLGEDFASDVINSGSWMGYAATLADPMEGTVVFKASGIAANQDGAFYISMFHDGSKDYGQAGDGITFWLRTFNNTVLPENSTNEPIPFISGQSISPDKEYTFYVTYKVAEDYSKLTVSIRVEEESGAVVAESTTDVTNFKLTNFGEQTVESWLKTDANAKNHQTIYLNPGNSNGVNIMSAWAATQESDYAEPLDVTDVCSEEDLAPRQGDGALRVSYERGSFTEILARFDDSLIPDMPVERLCEVSVKIFNYSEEEKTVTLSLMKEQNLAVALDDNEFTLAPYAWTECKLSMDSVVVEYLAKELIGINVRFKDVADSVYYLDDFRVSFESEYGEGSLALIEKVEALTEELKGLKDKKITKEDKELLVSLYTRYLDLPMAYQYMVNNVDLLQEAIKSYYDIISKEELEKGSTVLLHANEILGVSQFGEYAGGTVSYTTEDKVDGDGCVSLDFDGSVDYINIPITPTSTNGFAEVHLWVNNPTENKYAVYLNWKLSDAAVGESILEDNAVGGYLIPAKSGWVELVYRSEFTVAEINVAMLDKRNVATPATDNLLIGKIVGYVNPVKTVSPHVKKVEKMIEDLSAYYGGYSKTHREEVVKAREAYLALTETQQGQVSNISKLIEIEASIWREGFYGIPKDVAKITKYDREIEKKFEALRTAYEELDPGVQKAVQYDMNLLEQLEDKMSTFGKNALHFNESIEQAGEFEGGKGTYTTAEHFAGEEGSLKLTFDGSLDWITVPVTPSKLVPYDELHIWVNNTSDQNMAFYLNWNGSTSAIGKKLMNDNLVDGYVLPAKSGWVELVYTTPFDLSELNIVALGADGNAVKTTGTLHVGKAMYVYNIYEVIDMIAALDGKDWDAIWAARAAYDALIPESQKKVTNLAKLRKYEKAMIDEVEALIDALAPYSTSYTSAEKQAVRAARAAYDRLQPQDQKKVKNISKLIEIEKKLAVYGETILHFDESIEQAGTFAGGKGSYTTKKHYADEKGSLKLTFNGSVEWVTVPVTPSKNGTYDELHIWVNNTSNKRMAFQLNWHTADAAIGDCVIGGNIDGGYVLPAKSGWVELIYRTQFELTEMNIVTLDDLGNATKTTGTLHVGRAEYVYKVSEVKAMIAALDGKDAEAVKAARAAYNALSESNKKKVTNIDKLIKYEVQLFKAGFAGVPRDVSSIKEYDAKLDVKLAKLRAEYDALDPAVQKLVKAEKKLLTQLQNKLATFRINVLHFHESIEQAGEFAGGKGTYSTSEHYKDENGSLKLKFDGAAPDWVTVPVKSSSNAAYDELHIWVNNTSNQRMAFQLNWHTADEAIGDCVVGENLEGGYVLPAKSGWVELIYRTQFELTEMNIVALDDLGNATKTTGTLHVGKAEYVYLASEVKAMIAALDGKDVEAVKAAREAYNVLPASSKKKVTNINKLINYEVEIFKTGFTGLPQDASTIKKYDAKLDVKLAKLRAEYEALDSAVKELVKAEEKLLTQLQDKMATFRINVLHFNESIEQVGDFTGGTATYSTSKHYEDENGSLKLEFDGASPNWVTIPVASSSNAAYDELHIWVNNTSDKRMAFQLNWHTADAAIGDCVTDGNLVGGYVLPAKSGWVELIYRTQFKLTEMNIVALDDLGNAINTKETIYVGKAEYVYLASEVVAQIEELDGTDRLAVKAARAAYEALTAESKAKVTNLAKLEEMEALFADDYTLTDLTENAYAGNLAQSSVSVPSWVGFNGNLPNAMKGTITFKATGIAASTDGAMYISLFHDASTDINQAGDGIMTYLRTNDNSLLLPNSTSVPFESGQTITADQTYVFYVAYKVADDYSKLTFSIRIETEDGTLIVDSKDVDITTFALSNFGSQTVKGWLKDHAKADQHQTLYINGGNSTALKVSAAW